MQPPKPKYLSSFGRNRGRSLRPYQQGLVDTLLPKLAVDLSAPLEGESEISSPLRGEVGRGGVPIGLSSTASPPHPNPLPQGERGYNAIALEIGFGGGEHLLAQAAHHPETLFIGCEPFINGVAKCLAGIDQQKLTNIRLFTQDARQLLEALPDQCLDTVFILFPDPWPKARHNKRRLVNHETLALLARVHKPGGRLLLATDHVDYSQWMLEHLRTTPHYQQKTTTPADWLTAPADWTETKYQRKTTAEGRAPQFFECVRSVRRAISGDV